jgi:hypothetical protein
MGKRARRQERRVTVEECLCLDIRTLRQTGAFVEDNWGVPCKHEWLLPGGNPVARIDYMVVPRPTAGLVIRLSHPMRYFIEITEARCFHDKVQLMFRCPLVINEVACRRRVRKLYLANGAGYLGCRNCWDLTYQSCQQHDRRVDALVRSPSALLLALQSPNIKRRLLAVRANTERLRRLRRKMVW